MNRIFFALPLALAPALPMQAGIVGLEPPAPPSAAAIAPDFDEQMQQVARAAAGQVEELSRVLAEEAERAGRPGLRFAYLEQDGDGLLWLRCLDTAQELPVAAQELKDYVAAIDEKPWISAESADEAWEGELPDAARTDSYLAQLRAEELEPAALIASLRGSHEIHAELAAYAAPENMERPYAPERARLEWLGLIAVNDAARPWRWAACFTVPTGEGGAVEQGFVLQDGRWTPTDAYLLCPYFRRDCQRDEEAIGQPRLNCLYPPALTEKGQALLREAARNGQDADALDARMAALLQSVRDRASAEAAVEPLRDLIGEDIALEERGADWMGDVRGFTRESFAPENMLTADAILERHGMGGSGDDAPYWDLYEEVERLDAADCYGVGELDELIQPMLHF